MTYPEDLHQTHVAMTARMRSFAAFASSYEAYGYLAVAVADLFRHVRAKQAARSLREMHDAAIRVGALAMRFAEQIRLDASREVLDEATDAAALWPTYNSPHEGYGVLLEEVEEFAELVGAHAMGRNHDRMFEEAVQVAAVALRFANDTCTEERGRR